MRLVATAILLVGIWAAPAARAADLDGLPPFADLPSAPPAAPAAALKDEALVAGAVIAPSPVPPVLDQVMTPLGPTPPATGPLLVVPGLNGPSGPPVYPLLPFAFGYGY